MTPLELQEKAIQASRNRERFIYPYISREFFKIDVPVTKTDYKIAVVFSGGLRNFDVTMEWANKFLIDPLKADVFFHGWCTKRGIENDERLIKNYHNLKKFKILKLEQTPLIIPEVLKNKFPDHARQSKTTGLSELILAEHIVGQLSNLKKGFELVKEYEQETNIKYDILIRARPDVFFYANIKDEALCYVMDHNSIATAQNYFSVICGTHQINDMFFIGRSDIMKNFSTLYDKIEEFGKSAPDDAPTEYYITCQFRHMNLFIHEIDANFIVEYPHDFNIEKGFTNSTMRHKYQNDSEDAERLTTQILGKN